MHVLHLIKTSEGATWAINQIKELKKLYPHITYSVVIQDGGKHLQEYYDVCKSVYILDFKLNLSIFKTGVKLRKIVKEDEPDIIHSWFTQTTLYARFFLRDSKIPRLFQVVGPLHLENKLFKFFDIYSAKKNDYWIATSKYIYNKYKDANVSAVKLFLNYAFIDVKVLLEQKEIADVEDFRGKYNIRKEDKIIGTASYIYPPKFYENTGVKNHELLLDVFKEVLSERKDVYLIISGSTFGNNSKYEKLLKAKAKLIDDKRIIFTGKYKNVYSVISNFNVFVYLSKSENLGGVFESLLYEIPTISSDRGALPELVINNKTGYNVSLNDKIIIKEKIIDLLDNKNKDFKLNGKKKVTDIFNKETLLTTAFKIYNSVKIQ
jgi:glycosyltransferase involved in cell wall biosynthesis